MIDEGEDGWRGRRSVAKEKDEVPRRRKRKGREETACVCLVNLPCIHFWDLLVTANLSQISVWILRVLVKLYSLYPWYRRSATLAKTVILTEFHFLNQRMDCVYTEALVELDKVFIKLKNEKTIENNYLNWYDCDWFLQISMNSSLVSPSFSNSGLMSASASILIEVSSGSSDESLR